MNEPTKKPGPNTVAAVQPRAEGGQWLAADNRRELTGMQAAFAVEYARNGGNGSKAALSAGYSPDTAKDAAWRLTRLPWVQRAIDVERKRLIQELGLAGIAVLLDVLRDSNADRKLRVKAAEIALKSDRADRDAGKDSDGAGKRLNEMTVAELEALVRRLDSAAELARLPILEHNEPSPHEKFAQVIDPAEESTAL